MNKEMVNYVWTISSLDVKIKEGDLEKIIETIHYRYKLEDGESMVDVYGSLGLDAPESESFKPFDEITEADVISWLESKLDIESLKSSLDSKLESVKNPTHVNLTLVS